MGKTKKTSSPKSITINGQNFVIRPTIRAMFIYEQIKNESFSLRTVMDTYLYYYAIILANNQDQFIEWDDFLDAIDTDPTIGEQIQDLMLVERKKEELLQVNAKDDDGKEVKKN